MKQIIETTAGKYIGLTFENIDDLELPDGCTFKSAKEQQLSGGLVRYSNTNYVLLTKEI